MDHVHHAGNSSGIVDGAAAVADRLRAAGEAAGLRPRGRIRAYANIGSDPALMLTGPVDVTRKILAKTGLSLSDIDLFEVNEAFAGWSCASAKPSTSIPEAVNVNGGAIALGHPLGATGAMISARPSTSWSGPARRGADHPVHRRGMGNATIIEGW